MMSSQAWIDAVRDACAAGLGIRKPNPKIEASAVARAAPLNEEATMDEIQILAYGLWCGSCGASSVAGHGQDIAEPCGHVFDLPMPYPENLAGRLVAGTIIGHDQVVAPPCTRFLAVVRRTDVVQKRLWGAIAQWVESRGACVWLALENGHVLDGVEQGIDVIALVFRALTRGADRLAAGEKKAVAERTSPAWKADPLLVHLRRIIRTTATGGIDAFAACGAEARRGLLSANAGMSDGTHKVTCDECHAIYFKVHAPSDGIAVGDGHVTLCGVDARAPTAKANAPIEVVTCRLCQDELRGHALPLRAPASAPKVETVAWPELAGEIEEMKEWLRAQGYRYDEAKREWQRPAGVVAPAPRCAYAAPVLVGEAFPFSLGHDEAFAERFGTDVFVRCERIRSAAQSSAREWPTCRVTGKPVDLALVVTGAIPEPPTPAAFEARGAWLCRDCAPWPKGVPR